MVDCTQLVPGLEVAGEHHAVIVAGLNYVDAEHYILWFSVL